MPLSPALDEIADDEYGITPGGPGDPGGLG
ncbi:hypothetical protein AQ1_00727 [alpha proteobacterium Q-1]|nr:hypothetical protein AQ1_00727 [alpha proteobacterium Q-1]